MSAEESKFYIWWNSYEVKRKVGAAYSIGAAVVIIGAMFKILHFEGAGYMLGAGMTVEAILFALGVFDTPHKDFEWEKIFDFNSDPINGIAAGTGLKSGNGVSFNNGNSQTRSVGLEYTETINDEDVKKLSEGIKNLSETAMQLSSLTGTVGATEAFAKNINEANQVTAKFIKTQDTLNSAAGLLTNSYQGISDGMETVEKNTKQYAGNVETINKNLSSINSIYEIQLKNIQANSEGLNLQTERLRDVYEELGIIFGDMQRMKAATAIAAEETENYKTNTIKLSKQIENLNHVYGNMLNALN